MHPGESETFPGIVNEGLPSKTDDYEHEHRPALQD
jgi:hypothetical protein